MKRELLLGALVVLCACNQVKKIDDGTDTGSDSAVPAAVQQRLTESCALPTCHAGSVAPDLSVASGGAWVTQSGAGGPFVSFGDVANSYLVEKMFAGPSAGSQMPLAPGVIEPEDLALVVGWVAGVELPDGENAEESGTGGGGVSYSADVRPIFASHGCLACHHDDSAVDVDIVDPFSGPNGLVGSLNTWAEAYPEGNTPELNVEPGDAEASFLIDKLVDPYVTDPAVGGGPMPLNLERLTDQEIADLRAWIDAGANDDETFEDVIAPIFGDETRLGARGGKCTYCHNSFGGQSPNLTDPFDPEAGAVGVASLFDSDSMIIEPGNAEGSVLVQKVEATAAGAFGGPMPPSYAPLDETELETVRAWIEAGAQDN
ncbi:MAG: hypothetical protein KUG77_15570 [Nannocystaceae bacterium]|nr:hypothetical protein [Nannocystaceae bacterium]